MFVQLQRRAPEGLRISRNVAATNDMQRTAGRAEAVAQSGETIMWNQVYNPFNNSVLSTLAAALPVVTLLLLIASNKVKAHIAAVVALIVANLVAIILFTMPVGLSLRATVLGAVTGFFPIGWVG